MPVGLLPALGGGIRQLAASGQASRLIDGYLKPYARAFDQLFYFSYLQESLSEFTDDPELLVRARVLSPGRPMGRGRRAVSMPWAHAAEFRSCGVLRVFQVTGVIPAIIVNARFGVPYVTTYGFWYAQLSQPGPKRLFKGVVERVGLRRAAAVIVTTEELRVRVARLARQVHLIPNGVDTNLFAPVTLAARGSGGGPRRVLYVGRLSAEKNLSALVKAAALLQSRVPIRLVMAGVGPLKEELRAEADAAGVSLEFLGVVDQRRLPPVYASADVFVLPSFTEGHPKVLLEAMSCGVPCLASNIGGNRSILANGEAGILFDPRDTGALANGLEHVFSQEEFARGLGERARARVLERYDLGVLVKREIELLHRVAASRP